MTTTIEPPELPYAGTSGYSGTDTSEARARDADEDGTTSVRQAEALSSVGARFGVGMTWRELGTARGWHHGTASGVLSVLHKAGRLARLMERRDRCRVYVLPEYVNGRETDAQGRQRPVDVVDQALSEWLSIDGLGNSRADTDPAGFVLQMRTLTGYGSR